MSTMSTSSTNSLPKPVPFTRHCPFGLGALLTSRRDEQPNPSGPAQYFLLTRNLGLLSGVNYLMPKFVERVRQITFSGRNARRTGQEVLYVTEAAVFRLTPEGVRLEEIAPGLDLERDILPQLGFRPPIKEPLGLMAPELYGEAPLPAALFPQFQISA